MKLKVLGSSSSGNCYLIENEKECLVIEAGVNFKYVLRELDFNISKITGCLISHEHKDHSKYVNDFIKNGISVYMSKGTAEQLSIKSIFLKIVSANKLFKSGSFEIIAFNTKHDCAEPFGYYIRHNQTGNILFATDTYYIPNKFKELNNILIECNYSYEILKKNIENGLLPLHIQNRIIQSHMELETCKSFLKANDLSQVNNIVLIHLSDNNSNSKRFVKEIKEIQPFANVIAAEKNMDIEFNKYRF